MSRTTLDKICRHKEFEQQETILQNAHSYNSINVKSSDEQSITFDIKYSKRIGASKAWYNARQAGYPLNMMLQFSFDKDLTNPRKDIELVRKVTHWIRLALTDKGSEHFIMWSRFTGLDDKQEHVTMLVAIEDKHKQWFQNFVKGWKHLNVTLTPVTYSKDIEVDGKFYSAFDVLMKAADAKTRHLMPNVLSQVSGAIWRPRVFYSQKLARMGWFRPTV